MNSKAYNYTQNLLWLFGLVVVLGCRPSNPSPINSGSSQPSEKVSVGNEPVQADKAGSDEPTFAVRDVADLSQCNFNNGREAGLNTILEIVGGGVACLDFDHDGQCDLFFARGGRIDAQARRVYGLPWKVLRGRGNWQYEDCSLATSIENADIYAHGLEAADWDNDGFEDLLVYGYNGIQLYQNLGDGTFQPLAATAGLNHTHWTTAVAWVDLNSDNLLDLFLGSYVNWNFDNHTVCHSKTGEGDVCSPNVFAGQTNTVFLNQGDGTFNPAPKLLPDTQPAKTLGAVAAEFIPGNGVDLYVANDLIANFLFTRKVGQWEERAFSAGAAVDDDGVANGSMGVAVLDFNLDQQPDLFVTNFEHEKMALYLNHGQDGFHYYSRQAGLNRNDLQLVGFGVVAADFDGDMDEDILFNTGHVHYHPDNGPMEQLPAYLQNEAGRRFKKLIPNCRYFTEPAVGRGLATADLDNDGDLDCVATSLFGSPRLLENLSRDTTQWISLQMVGTQSARYPVGTTVELAVGPQKMMRQLYGGGSYLSHSQSILHFAWPKKFSDLQTVQLKIRWPTGRTVVAHVAVGQHTVLVEEKASP